MNILKRQGLRHITQVDLERKYFKTVHICRAGKKVLSDSLEGWYQLVYILHCRTNRSRREALKEKIIKKEVVHIVGLESKYNKIVQSKIINSLGQKSKLQKPDKIFQFESPVTDWNIYQQLLTMDLVHSLSHRYQLSKSCVELLQYKQSHLTPYSYKKLVYFNQITFHSSNLTVNTLLFLIFLFHIFLFQFFCSIFFCSIFFCSNFSVPYFCRSH